MANIDVTPLFTDSDFIDEMRLITRSATVSTMGENLISESAKYVVGCIQPAEGKLLNRLPEALRNERVNSFWINGAVLTTENCKYPSILEYRGKRYQIRKLFDYTNWGAGWTEGVCVEENLT